MSAVLKLLSKAAFTWRRDTIAGQILRLPLLRPPEDRNRADTFWACERHKVEYRSGRG